MKLEYGFKFNQGFSLIELMVVVAIIGVLAMIAVPAYDGYMLRAKATHITTMANDIKKGIIEYRAINGGFPTGGIPQVYAIPNPADKYASVNNGVTSGTCNINSGLSFSIIGTSIFGATNGPEVIYTATYVQAESSKSAGLVWKCDYILPTNATVTTTFLPECTQLSTGTVGATPKVLTCA